MFQVTLFISAVSSEFTEDPAHAPERVGGPGDYRTYLRDKLTGPDVCVKVQEDFIAGGVLTLDKLVLYLKECDAVIQLVGDMTGAIASDVAIESLFESESQLPRKIPFLATPAAAGALGVTYTQWEAYLAHHYGKRLVVCSAQPHAPRAGKHAVVMEQRASQDAHLERLKKLERYAEISFASREELAVEVLRMLRTLLPRAQGDALPAPPLKLPYASLGELFIGRDDFLAGIRASVEKAKLAGRWPRQVVNGLGGMGKTRLAVEYAWRYREDYTAVLLVNGESEGALGRELASLAGVFHLDVDPSAPEPQRTRMALEWLQQHPGWLLIIDNVDDEEARSAVAGRLTEWSNGHVLITGRVTRWPRDVEPLDLRVLSAEDATRFLLEATRDSRSARNDDAEQAQRLANDELGALCLALEQAAAYVNKLELSLAEYRKRWATNAKDVRSRADKSMMRYHEEKDVSLSVATTWRTTVDSLGITARSILEMLSWLAPEPIPGALLEHEMFAKRLNVLTGKDDDDVEEALAELRSYSMLSRRQSIPVESAGQVHRLVQLITRDSLSEDDRAATLASTLFALEDYTAPEGERIRLAELRNLAPHLSAVIAHGESVGLSKPVASLLRVQGEYLDNEALYASAEAAYRRALAIDEQIFGDEHFLVAFDLFGLANVLAKIECNDEAEVALRRALAILDREVGASDPKTARVLDALSALLANDGRYQEAEPIIRRAIAIAEGSGGAESQAMSDYLVSLSRVCGRTDRLPEAVALSRRAVALSEVQLGADHVGTAHAIDNLALMLGESGEHEEAETLLRRELLIVETNLGRGHPHYANALAVLGRLLVKLGRWDEAEPMLVEALSISERTLGENNRNVAAQLTDLALVSRMRGAMEESESRLRRALAVATREYGPDHPEVAIGLGNLGINLVLASRVEEGRALLRDALAIDVRHCGEAHPATIRDLANLGRTALVARDTVEADEYFARALAAIDAAYGAGHESGAQLLAERAQARRALGILSAAEAESQGG